MQLTKQYLHDLFGKRNVHIARALEVKPQTSLAWPDDLPDSVIGKFVKLHPKLAKRWINEQMKVVK